MTDQPAASATGSEGRSQWRGRLGFILAAAGSAVGLGNIWKFPYITGENGGGLFVLIYLGCIVVIGIPIMIAEVTLGRTTQTSVVGSFRKLSKPGSPWLGVGWLGVATAFVLLSFYSVVAGWALHYVWLSLTGTFSGEDTETVSKIFDGVYTSPGINLWWHFVFMAMTIGIVVWGVQKGVERAARILMPALFGMMLILLGYSMTLDGFGQAFSFVFSPNADKLTGAGVLEALGHSFFTLSLGMGAMLTYGSYLSKKDDAIASSVAISILDTVVALLACLILFPITYTFQMEPSKTVGLVFYNMPVAFAQLPGGTIWALIFFVLLVFAALSSAISLLEVAVSYFVDEKGMSRRVATFITGGSIFVLGIPSALSGSTALFGDGFKDIFGKNWFDSWDYLVSNWSLPLGGLGVAMFMAWRVGGKAREEAFTEGSKWGMKNLYLGWLVLLRYVVPVGIGLVFLNAVGVFKLFTGE